MSNPSSRGQQRDKPFRDALRMAIADASGEPKRLRRIAEALLSKAEDGDIPSIKEVADRLDGKPAQSVEHGGDEDNPIVHRIERIIVRASTADSDLGGV